MTAVTLGIIFIFKLEIKGERAGLLSRALHKILLMSHLSDVCHMAVSGFQEPKQVGILHGVGHLAAHANLCSTVRPPTVSSSLGGLQAAAFLSPTW
jgi:hypothetical protein